MRVRALPSRRRRRAFTLIELMFALAIGLFVVAALYNLFIGQMHSFMYQDLQMEMHQNARLSADILSRTARLAGYGTASTTVGAFGSGGDDNNSLPAIISYDNVGPNGSDAVTLVSMDPALVVNTAATAPPSCAATSLSVNPAALHNAARIAQYHDGELLMCYDYAALGGFRSFLWPLTADGDATTGELQIGSGSGYGDYDAACPIDHNLPLVMTCSRAEVATFYIDADDTDGIGAGSPEHPVLMMDLDFESPDADDVPLVDNVEDLQIAYCLQAAAGTTDCSDPSAWVDTIASDEADDVYMIRIGIVVRSSRTDPARLFPGERPALENNTGGSADHYYRQVLSTEVTVRNLRIQSLL